jgi:hypothetical protein
MNNNFLLAAAMAALPPGPMIDMLPRGQRRIGPKCGARNARGPLPASKRDYESLLQPYLGKAYRHRFTGQVRRLGEQQCPDGYVAMYNSTMGCWRSPRKALDWLRNAVEV